MLNVVKNLVGGAIGGVVGFYFFEWFLNYNLYAMIAPGGLIGLGASFFKHRFLPLPFITGVAAFVLGMFTEWRHWPMRTDPSFGYFLMHPQSLTPPSLLMILAGTALGFYLPYASYRKRDLAG
jgi:hypothetical protein